MAEGDGRFVFGTVTPVHWARVYFRFGLKSYVQSGRLSVAMDDKIVSSARYSVVRQNPRDEAAGASHAEVV